MGHCLWPRSAGSSQSGFKKKDSQLSLPKTSSERKQGIYGGITCGRSCRRFRLRYLRIIRVRFPLNGNGLRLHSQTTPLVVVEARALRALQLEEDTVLFDQIVTRGSRGLRRQGWESHEIPSNDSPILSKGLRICVALQVFFVTADCTTSPGYDAYERIQLDLDPPEDAQRPHPD